MTIVQIPLDVFPARRPYNNITPFTYRDGMTYLQVLESLREYIRDVLVPHLDIEIGELVENWDETVDALLLDVDAKIAAYKLEVDGQLDTAIETVLNSNSTLAAYVDDAIQSIVDSTVSVSDPTILATLQAAGSQSLAFLDGRYARDADLDTLVTTVGNLATIVGSKASDDDVNTIEAILNTGRLSATTLDTRFDAKAPYSVYDLVTTGRLAQAALDAKYSQVPLYGLYAARPAANTVKSGTLYYATNTQETYRAVGAAGAAATSWTPVFSGGNELAYAEMVSGFNIAAGTAGEVAIPGLAFSLTVPERPFMLELSLLISFVNTTTQGNAYIKDVTAGANVRVLWGGNSGNANDVNQVNVSKRISGLAAGTVRQYQAFAGRLAGISWDILGADTYPATLKAVSC